MKNKKIDQQKIVAASKAVEKLNITGHEDVIQVCIKKQIGRKPATTMYGNYDEFEYKCPVCGVILEPCKNYCYNCGQRMRWSE